MNKIKKGASAPIKKKVAKIEQYPVPCMANKARVFNSIKSVIDSEEFFGLSEFLIEISKFIDKRCD